MLNRIKSTFILLGILFLTFFTPPKPGAIVLVGGAHIPKQAVVWFMNQSIKGDCIVITRHPKERKEYWEGLVGEVKIMVPEEFTSLNNVGSIIIGGGNQWDYLTNLNKTLIQQAHDQGIPIMGNSAGAMILGEHCFSAEKGTITSDEVRSGEEEKILICRFLNIKWLKGCIVDTHFSERDRGDRLKAFVKKSPAKFGIGIDEGTALCINNHEVIVMGEGNVKLSTR